VIIFDANILISLANQDPNSDIYERISGLVSDLEVAKTIIGVPAPAWAEFLCGTDIATSGIVLLMRKRSSMRVLPFDEVAAFETAMIHRGAMATGKKRGNAKGPWQPIKVDRQILAIARQHQVTKIYTADDEMIAEASRLGIETIRPEEIPLKSKQNNLDLQVSAVTVESKSSGEKPSDATS
jgi:predicted nucleic acid-binding protein